MDKKVRGFKKTVCLFFLLVLIIPGFCKNRAASLELNLIGFEVGAGSQEHALMEGPYVGLNYRAGENVGVNLTVKYKEIFFCESLGDYPFVKSSYPLYLSLILDTDKNFRYYFSVGGDYWSVLYDRYYISSAIGFKQKLSSSGAFSISSVGCELQWIRVSENNRRKDIISLNLTLALANLEADFGQ